jgi:hypothetical protein
MLTDVLRAFEEHTDDVGAQRKRKRRQTNESDGTAFTK